MRSIIIILFTFLLYNYCNSQNLDQSIKSMADNITSKVIDKNKSKIALSDFVNNSGKSDALTKYITDQMEMDLVNSNAGLHVMDRKYIKQILAEHHLQSEGLIDESVAKSSISFIKVDGWMVGEIISFGEGIKITVKIIDITTSEILAMESTGIIKDNIIKSLQQNKKELEVANIPEKSIDNSKIENNNNSDCIKNNTGDICFTNATQSTICVYISTRNLTMPIELKLYASKITIDSKETSCNYNLRSREYYYYVTLNVGRYPQVWKSGQIRVEKCKSETKVIK